MNECLFCGEPIRLTHSRDIEAHAFLHPCPKCLNVSLFRPENNGLTGTRLHPDEDIRNTAPRGTIPGEILARMSQTIEELPVLPEIPQRIMALVHDPLTTMHDLGDILNQDAVIATKILKLANSAAFGGRQSITGLEQACSRLGIREVARTVQAIAHSNLYRVRDPKFRDLMQQLWQHTVATAHCAYEIADMRHDGQKDALFVAGLVHDIGSVVLLEIISKSPVAAASRLRDDPNLIRDFFSRFHSLAGLHVASKRDLPIELGFTTYFHDQPEKVSTGSPCQAMVHTIHLAERVADASGYGFDGNHEPLTDDDPSARFLGITDEQLGTLREKVRIEVEALLDALAM